MKKIILIVFAGATLATLAFSCQKERQSIPPHYIDNLKGSFSTALGTCCGTPTPDIPGTNFAEPGEGLGDEISWDVVGAKPTSYFYKVKPISGSLESFDTTWQLLVNPPAQQGEVQIGFRIGGGPGAGSEDSVYVKAIYTYPQFPGHEDSVTVSGVFSTND